MDLERNREEYQFTRYNKKTRQYELVDMITGECTSLELSTKPEKNDIMRYSRELGSAICELIRGGETVSRISTMAGFPPAAIIYKWKTVFPHFAEAMEAAYQDRAYHLADKVMDDLDEMETLDKDQVPAKKLQVDTAFKLMEKTNPERFGNKVKLSGDKDAPLQILIDTGIRRPDDEGFDKEEFEAIDAKFSKIGEEDTNESK